MKTALRVSLWVLFVIATFLLGWLVGTIMQSIWSAIDDLLFENDEKEVDAEFTHQSGLGDK